MVKRKFTSLIFVLLLILSACGLREISTEEPVVSTKIATIPSSTFLPTETKLPIPTATLSLTPLPTLSGEETFRQLYMSEDKCNMPCWWGIVPGISPWPETQQFIEQFSSLSFGVERAEGKKRITNSLTSEMYEWHVGNPRPNTGSATSVYVEIQDNYVIAIEVGPELVEEFFPIYELLNIYGQPEEVFIFASTSESNTSDHYAFVYLIYEDKHLLAKYLYFGHETTNLVNLCLNEFNEQGILLWAPNKELNIDFSNLKSLGEYSDLDIYAFYEKFKDQHNKCFEISRDAWK